MEGFIGDLVSDGDMAYLGITDPIGIDRSLDVAVFIHGETAKVLLVQLCITAFSGFSLYLEKHNLTEQYGLVLPKVSVCPGEFNFGIVSVIGSSDTSEESMGMLVKEVHKFMSTDETSA